MQLQYTPTHFTSADGYIQTTVPVCLRKTIDSYIEQSTKPANKHLAGHIKKEFFLSGLEKNKLWVDLIISSCLAYCNEFPMFDTDIRLLVDAGKEKLSLELQTPWVNKMKKYEFNPLHRHSGLFSYVMWVTIPYDIQEELALFKLTKSNRTSLFEFAYSTATFIRQHCINIDKSYEGELIVFPASQMHCVNPFYTSDKERISIAGNVNFKLNKNSCTFKRIKNTIKKII